MLNIKNNSVHDLVLPVRVPASFGLRYLLRLVRKKRIHRPAVIYLDASHEYAATLSEVQLAWDLLPPGGFLVGDDYCNMWPGVVSAVDAHVESAHSLARADAYACAFPFASRLERGPPPRGSQKEAGTKLLMDKSQWILRKAHPHLHPLSVPEGENAACHIQPSTKIPVAGV